MIKAWGPLPQIWFKPFIEWYEDHIYIASGSWEMGGAIDVGFDLKTAKPVRDINIGSELSDMLAEKLTKDKSYLKFINYFSLYNFKNKKEDKLFK